MCKSLFSSGSFELKSALVNNKHYVMSLFDVLITQNNGLFGDIGRTLFSAEI